MQNNHPHSQASKQTERAALLDVTAKLVTWYTCIVTAVNQNPETHIFYYPLIVNEYTLADSMDPSFDAMLIASSK